MANDNMTGLPSMVTFFESAEASRKRMQAQRVDSVILFFDLTDLKSFNRWHGFAEGNRLICAMAAILAEQFGMKNCARFAQDHFAAIAVANGLEKRLDAVIAECAAANNGKTLPLRIGVYPNSIEAVPIDVACDRARLASNVYKNRKESYYAFFDQRMLEKEKVRQAIIDNLDQAIEEYIDARNNATSNAEINEARDHVILECADVRACVDQVLWHLHGEEECDAAMQWKLIGTMQRIRDDAE